jgi:hypothetical protein
MRFAVCILNAGCHGRGASLTRVFVDHGAVSDWLPLAPSFVGWAVPTTVVIPGSTTQCLGWLAQPTLRNCVYERSGMNDAEDIPLVTPDAQSSIWATSEIWTIRRTLSPAVHLFLMMFSRI